MMKNKVLERKIEILSEMLASFEKNLEKTNKQIEALTNAVTVSLKPTQRIGAQQARLNLTEHLQTLRAKTEQLGERNELSEQPEQPLRQGSLSSIRGRHREILAMLINNGFHTYEQIAKRLNISQSRARAYIAELKNDFGVPLTQVRDPEGYKVGIDVRFVEQILSSK